MNKDIVLPVRAGVAARDVSCRHDSRSGGVDHEPSRGQSSPGDRGGRSGFPLCRVASAVGAESRACRGGRGGGGGGRGRKCPHLHRRAAAPRAEACAMRAGRFIAVGSNAEVRALIGKGTQVFDAQRMTVVPGFIDCHNHAAGDDAALRGPRRQSVRGRVRHDRQHRREAAARRPQHTAAGHLGRRRLLRRHQGQGRARRSTSTTWTRSRATSRSPCTTAAATPRSTTARRSSWPGITKDTPNPPAAPSTATPTASSTAASPTARRAVFDKVGQRPDLHGRADAQRDRDGAGVHLQAVRPLRPDQRAPRGRRSCGALAGRSARAASSSTG